MKKIIFPVILIFSAILSGCTLIEKPGSPGTVSVDTIPPSLEDAGDNSPVSETNNEKIIFRIDGRDVGQEEFEKRYLEYLLVADPEKEQILNRREFLDLLIREELVRLYAEQERIDKDPSFKALLEREKQRLLVDYILNNRLMSKTVVTDEEMLTYYNENRDQFIRPAKIQVRHIQTITLEEAREVKERLENGESFSEVAADVSIHSSRNQGGRLPPFLRGSYDPDFEAAAFPLKVGERSEIVRTDLGYHIIEKTSETPENVIPFDQVRGLIMEKIVEERKAEVLEEFYSDLKRQANVQVLAPPEMPE